MTAIPVLPVESEHRCNDEDYPDGDSKVCLALREGVIVEGHGADILAVPDESVQFGDAADGVSRIMYRLGFPASGQIACKRSSGT
jgi:hypothetical protein